MTEGQKFAFANWEGKPVRVSNETAFVFMDGEWEPANRAVVGLGARLMSEVAFGSLFGDLPSLPVERVSRRWPVAPALAFARAVQEASGGDEGLAKAGRDLEQRALAAIKAGLTIVPDAKP